MPVNLSAPNPSDLHPVPGVKLGITMAGVRKANRRDLTVITLDEGGAVAGVFTKNRYCAAPVQICREHLQDSSDIRALVINTGNANVAPALLQGLVTDAANASFNRITVDGDTSTNDSFVLIATRKAAHAEITDVNSPDGQALRAALIEVSQKLAQAIVRDGEGATKFISVTIEGGRTEAECALAAYAIAHSPLVKTAFFASDPNLGRILAAVGYAGIDDLDQNLIEMHLDDVHVVTKGGRNPAYREEDGQRIMKQSEITIRVNLGRGQAATTVWTCDLSHDYVSINADYRS